MKYKSIVEGRFLERPNRFIAKVEINGRVETVHVKNTGRCKELLQPGTKVFLEKSANQNRSTTYDLVAVQRGERLINMDSQAPNTAAGEWLEAGGLGPVQELRREVRNGASRFDFAFTLDTKPCFLEVKGVTLEQNGICAFPDAPTQRGVKHLRELTELAQKGFGAYVLFVIQMADVQYLQPNDATDPAFGTALRDAAAAGVQLLAMDCSVTPETMTLRKPVEIKL